LPEFHKPGQHVCDGPVIYRSLREPSTCSEIISVAANHDRRSRIQDS
jgi:hypothetical protein